MKLSEAIRLGSTLRPQAHGGLYETREVPMHQNSVLGLIKVERVASCALGAAFEAAGCGSHIEVAKESSTAFRGSIEAGEKVEIIEQPSEWNIVLQHLMACPLCGTTDQIRRLIPHLNDGHKVSREVIAKLIASVEVAIECAYSRSLEPESCDTRELTGSPELAGVLT